METHLCDELVVVFLFQPHLQRWQAFKEQLNAKPRVVVVYLFYAAI